MSAASPTSALHSAAIARKRQEGGPGSGPGLPLLSVVLKRGSGASNPFAAIGTCPAVRSNEGQGSACWIQPPQPSPGGVFHPGREVAARAASALAGAPVPRCPRPFGRFTAAVCLAGSRPSRGPRTFAASRPGAWPTGSPAMRLIGKSRCERRRVLTDLLTASGPTPKEEGGGER